MKSWFLIYEHERRGPYSLAELNEVLENTVRKAPKKEWAVVKQPPSQTTVVAPEKTRKVSTLNLGGKRPFFTGTYWLN